MKLRISAPDWSANDNEEKEAKCRKFSVKQGRDPWFDDEEEAVRICNGTDDGVVCPMRHSCLIFALVNNEHNGIWGGMNSDDRRTLRRFTPKEQWKWRPPSPKPDVSSPQES